MTTRSYDVIIVGTGAAGLSAAITARMSGLSVLVLEKTGLVGGSTSLSGGNLWLPNNPLLAADSITDSREAALRYLSNFDCHEGGVHMPARQRAFVDAVAPMMSLFMSQGMAYELSTGFPDNYDHLPGGSAQGRGLRAALYNVNWLGSWKARLRPPSFPLPVHASEGGVMLRATESWEGKAMVARIAGRTLFNKLMRRTVYGTGAALQGRMLEIALRTGVEILTDAPMTGLEMANGKATGVRVRHEGHDLVVLAGRGVILAAAGFAHNRAMRERFIPHPVDLEMSQASPGEEGDAAAALESAGAAFAYMEEAIWMVVWPFAGRALPVMSEPAKPGGMLVDATGRRFVNEGRPTNEIGRTIMRMQRHDAGNRAWFIADSRARRRYPFAFNFPGKIMNKWITDGGVHMADSLAGLAHQCGIDPSALEATVARFNAMAASGTDADFHRGDSAFSRSMGDPKVLPNPNLAPMDEPPYWAVPLSVSEVGTYGGAITDEHCRVLRSDGSLIEGLYAAGNCAAPLAGPWYPAAGFSIGVATVSGYLAARNLAG